MIIIYNLLKDFEEKDLLSYDFREELYLKLRKIVMEFHDKKEKEFYNDVVLFNKVNALCVLMVDLYEMGLDVGMGKTFEDYKYENDRNQFEWIKFWNQEENNKNNIKRIDENE